MNTSGLVFHDAYGSLGLQPKNVSSESARVKMQSDYIIRLEPPDFVGGRVPRAVRRLGELAGHGMSTGVTLGRSFYTQWKTLQIDPTLFRDFLWRRIFEKTLDPSDMDLVFKQKYFGIGLSYFFMHNAGLLGLPFPRLDTRDWDFFMAQTPFPGRVSPRPRLIVRYHDAIPIFLPHTIHSARKHKASAQAQTDDSA